MEKTMAGNFNSIKRTEAGNVWNKNHSSCGCDPKSFTKDTLATNSGDKGLRKHRLVI
jgi:hypothetical protein